MSGMALGCGEATKELLTRPWGEGCAQVTCTFSSYGMLSKTIPADYGLSLCDSVGT
jgi:hypothetical protein